MMTAIHTMKQQQQQQQLLLLRYESLGFALENIQRPFST